MTRTVDDLRNDVRQAVGRYERVESTAFTKEALAAICDAVDHDVDANSLPPKSRMRASILSEIGGPVGDDLDEADPDGDDPDEADPSEADPDGTDPHSIERPFRKAELEAIATAVGSE